MRDETIRVTGYRYCATGIWGYDFYREQEKLCTVSGLVIPSPPVRICGFEREWYSEFDEESTIVPGLTRYVFDSKTSREVARIIYKNAGKYEVLISQNHINVYIVEDEYGFYRNGHIIASIKRIHENNNLIPPMSDFDIEPYFSIFLAKQIELEIIMVILAFPMLQFGF